MHAFAPDRPRDDLNRTRRFCAPRANHDLAHSATPRGKQRGVPGQQPLLGQRRHIVLDRVQHHLDNAFHVAIGADKSGDVHAQTTGEGGAHLFLVEQLTFDFAGFQDLFGESLKDRFRAQLKAEPLHAPDQPSLPMADGSEVVGQALSAPSAGGPALASASLITA